MILQELCAVRSCRLLAENIYLLSFYAPTMAATAHPGQFVNIKPDTSRDPLLRRPFSIYRVVGDNIEVLFNIVGRGTDLLAHKKNGDTIDVLGPLGVPYGIDDKFETAILVSGGLGVAAMPFLTATLQKRNVPVYNFLGARTRSLLVTEHLHNVRIATDDGSQGHRGSIVHCLEDYLRQAALPSPKIFSCGPNRMLLALSDFAKSKNIPCEAALECAMACGIGICQGCPVEMTDGPRKYNLVCTDGPVFDVERINIQSIIGH